MSKFYKEKLEYFTGGYDAAGYWDYSFVDVDPHNSYEICYSESDDEWYGHISHAENIDSALYAEVRELTVEEVAECIDLIPGADFPSKLLCHLLDECIKENTMLKDRIADLERS